MTRRQGVSGGTAPRFIYEERPILAQPHIGDVVDSATQSTRSAVPVGDTKRAIMR